MICFGRDDASRLIVVSKVRMWFVEFGVEVDVARFGL